mmetsp:Transcript_15658/g.28470  ORF Transcript_15658/g.28470 Transcript_15658/m.28470 type:complete len:203 (+) Transcript_15658:476-1084(+)
MNFIHKQHTRNQLRHTLINVTIDDAVDFGPKFVRNFCFLWFSHGCHHTHDIPSSLGAGIGHVQIMQRYILHYLLLFVHVALWKWDILFCLQIKLGGKRITSTHTFHSSRVGFNVNDISHGHALFRQGIMNGWIETKRFGSLGCLEANDHVRNGSPVPTQGIFRLFHGKFNDFSFIHFFGLTNSKTNGTAKMFHENLRLFYFR